MTKIAFIGLGVMGYPMAGHLAKAGHTVTVYNRTQSKAHKWAAEFNASIAATPAEAAQDCDFIFTCVGNDSDLEEVTLGDSGIFKTIKAKAIYIDNTTASADIARKLYDIAKQKQCGCLDAPVSGGQIGAENGKLSVMVGGDKNDYDKAKEIIHCYAQNVQYIGKAGDGQLAKMVNQICIAGLVQALSEGLHFGRRSGLDMHNVIAAISQGAAGSWQMDNRAQTMLDNQFDFGFAIDWMRKDLAMCLDQARKNGAHIPVTALVDQFYAALQKKGYQRCDTSSLIKLLEDS